jgi:hypothetical protein
MAARALFLAALPTLASAQDKPVSIGAKATVSRTFWACKSDDDLGRIAELGAAQKDIAAATNYAWAHPCKILSVGDTGIAESGSVWSGHVCIREQGKPDCYWFPQYFLQRAD